MTPSRDKLLFIAASAFASAADRRAFLELACQGDEEMRQLIEELLEIDQDAEEFFEFQPEVENPESPPADDGGGEGGIGARIGPYRLIDRLGAGGCGVVYLAEQQEPVKRKVALKIIRLGMDTESVIARFNLEREALAMMDHANIARVLDAGATTSGRPYFAMELVDGEKITDFCDRKRLGLRQRLELFILVCEAIQHAHQKGVIHRDIKPSNVLVREDEGRMIPKVIDFGIAKATAAGLEAEGTVTRAGQLIGTPAYMSPEQAEGGVDIDTRSDIYSLGALLCELLTGSPPLQLEHFTERGVEQIRTLVREGETGVPSVRLREVPLDQMGEIAERRGVEPQRLPTLLAGDLDWIVMKAIEKDRQRRYETANGLAMDVRRYLREEPVSARPPSRRYLLSKLVRRNRGTFAAAGIALFGLLGGLGLSTWLFLREREARKEQARLQANELRLREDADAVERVAQAAVLRQNSKPDAKEQAKEQADAKLDGLPAERVPLSLEAANTFKEMANWNLEKARWKTAADRFNVLGHVLTSDYITTNPDREEISREMLSVMTALSLWGEPGQYDKIRRRIIKCFTNSANPTVAERVLKATLLEPANEEVLSGLQPLAEMLEASLDNLPKNDSAHLQAWREYSLAILAYRQNDLKAAAALARRSIETSAKNDSRSVPLTVSDQVILAMIDLKEGRVAEARDALKLLRQKVDGLMTTPFQIQNQDATLWYNQYAALILLKEAEKLLEEAGAEQSGGVK